MIYIFFLSDLLFIRLHTCRMQQRAEKMARVTADEQILSDSAQHGSGERRSSSQTRGSGKTFRFWGRHQVGSHWRRPCRRNSSSLRQNGRRKTSLHWSFIQFTATASATATISSRYGREQQHSAVVVLERKDCASFCYCSSWDDYWRCQRSWIGYFLSLVSGYIPL